jgi:glycosyltransferase involved in cell wall biosynthesis
MNVVHLVPALFGPDGVVGGAERYALELARHMAMRVPTTLVTFGNRGRDERVGLLAVKVLGHPWYVRGQYGNPMHLRLFSALRDADIVHCHQQHVLMSSAAAVWCRARRKRVFVSELGGGGWDVSAYVSTDRWFHGHLHLSNYSRRVYRHDRASNARVIGGGVDAQKFSPDPSVARAASALFVGRVLPHKGIDHLIRALPRDMPLTIAGPQPDRDTVSMLVNLAAGKHVSFKKGLDDAQLVCEYRRALCVVLPSVYRTSVGTETAVPELLGQTLLEGMACETPVICSNVASLPEVVEDGVTGFVVAANDSGALRDFTWDGVVGRCLDAYGQARSRPLNGRRFACDARRSIMWMLSARFASRSGIHP